jgi:hypothetical protein
MFFFVIAYSVYATQVQARVKASDDTLEQYRQQLQGYEELLSHLGDELSTCKANLINSQLAADGAEGDLTYTYT